MCAKYLKYAQKETTIYEAICLTCGAVIEVSDPPHHEAEFHWKRNAFELGKCRGSGQRLSKIFRRRKIIRLFRT